MSQAAKAVDGVIECKTDYKKGTAEVTFVASTTTPEIVAKAIADKTGYKVTLPKRQKR